MELDARDPNRFNDLKGQVQKPGLPRAGLTGAPFVY
jgi:hypothetical protein